MNKIKDDLSAIRDIMEKSVRFTALSGVSGILAGIYALVGSTIAYYLVYYPSSPFGFRFHYINEEQIILKLMIVAIGVLGISISTGVYFTWKRAKKNNTQLWNKTSRSVLIDFCIPLLTGGIFILILLSRDMFPVVASSCLIFYGLALINASHKINNEIHSLGIVQVIIGLLAAFLPGYGLLFWALGFGIAHIVFGIMLYLKYER